VEYDDGTVKEIPVKVILAAEDRARYEPDEEHRARARAMAERARENAQPRAQREAGSTSSAEEGAR
jgi:hypothetical protein